VAQLFTLGIYVHASLSHTVFDSDWLDFAFLHFPAGCVGGHVPWYQRAVFRLRPEVCSDGSYCRQQTRQHFVFIRAQSAASVILGFYFALFGLRDWRSLFSSVRSFQEPSRFTDSLFLSDMSQMPNKPPEPNAVAAAVAIHAVSRRWLSFLL
jgi:hypothetical protein